MIANFTCLYDLIDHNYTFPMPKFMLCVRDQSILDPSLNTLARE